MRFRTQMLLAFVPLFLLLGASGETVMAVLEHREMRWSADEQASSFAVALAEFLGDRPFATPNPPATGPINWEESLAAVLRRGQARSIDLFAAGGGGPPRHFGEAAPADEAAGLPPALTAQLARLPWVLGAITGRGAQARFAAYAPLRGPSGALVGYLRVQVSASDYVGATARELRRIGYGAGVSALAGLLAIGLVVLPVTRGTRELRTAADRAQTGETLTPPRSRLIQEIGDLGETFGTMSLLLGEAMDKTRRNLVENEQLRTARDLAAEFHSQFSRPESVRLGALEAEARMVGADPGGAFFICRAGGDALWAVVGAVAADDRLQEAMAASAARGLFADALGRAAPEAAAAEVAAVLPLASWTCLAWPPAGGAPRRWTGRGAALTEPVTSVAAAGPLCLHTFGPDRQRIIDTCLGGFAGLPAAEIAENLSRLLGEAAHGALVVLRRVPAV